MKVRCPDCGSKGVLNAELAGQMARCSRCGGKFLAKEDLAGDEGIKWYYAEGDQKIGPLNEAEFNLLVGSGTIAPATLVWRKGMRGWQALAETHGEEVEKQVASTEPRPRGEREETLGAKTSAPWAAGLVYAGGGQRLLAKIIDLVFMFTLATLVDGLSQRLFPAVPGAGGNIDKVYIITMLIDMLLGMIYITWFVGKFGATPGKMVFSLKVVTPSGGKVGYGQAFGRYWAESVVICTLLLGYLPILFDPQKRGLHDRLCNTRVVKI
jgi:uncharacterized RDD family membrane protein YckC/DNA-directed RNA polymerase subunit RPC12/RpoP